MSSLENAIAIAATAHKGQTDKAGAPYILHPLRMMMKMADRAAQIAAVLHDVVEDSPDEDKWTFERLIEAGFDDEVVEAVNCLTKREGEGYEEFIRRAATNPVACRVKIADLEDNMNVLRIGEIRPRDLERLEKYHRSWRYLSSV
jgi:(p)ppGpp synthase/HD superfamily hydrolase